MTSDRESVEKRLHDRIDDLVRELNEAERRLAENMQLNATNLEITREAVRHSNYALECLRRVMGEANGRGTVRAGTGTAHNGTGNEKPEAIEARLAGDCAKGWPSWQANAVECLRRVMGPARAAPPSPSAEQIETDYLERRGGR